MKWPASSPGLRATSAEAFNLSGPALLALMRAVLDRGATFRFRARGTSMMPLIRDGDVLSVSPLRRSPGLGDVVAFVQGTPERLAVHRVVALQGASCLIQGDNADGCPDGVVCYDQILGRVTCVERAGRRVRLGLGPERVLVALLSRRGMLWPLRQRVGPLLHLLRRRTE